MTLRFSGSRPNAVRFSTVLYNFCLTAFSAVIITYSRHLQQPVEQEFAVQLTRSKVHGKWQGLIGTTKLDIFQVGYMRAASTYQQQFDNQWCFPGKVTPQFSHSIFGKGIAFCFSSASLVLSVCIYFFFFLFSSFFFGTKIRSLCCYKVIDRAWNVFFLFSLSLILMLP